MALYFVVCFEILIMISPFAGFFYTAFNPFLLGLTKYRATRWLSSFFFTHIVVPPNEFLELVRILGSVFFSLGLLVFLVCAVQVYAGNSLARGLRRRACRYSSGILNMWLWRLLVLVWRFSGRDFWLFFSGLPWSRCITYSLETKKAGCKGSIRRPTLNTYNARGCFFRGALRMPSHSHLSLAKWQPFSCWPCLFLAGSFSSGSTR